MNRKIRSLQDSKKIIEPFHSELVQCIEKGFNDFIKVSEFVKGEITPFVDFKPRTKASLIHDMIKANTLELFSERENIQVGEFNKVFGINVNDELFVRFKKMSENYTVSSYLTPQHKNYMGQQKIIGFPDKPTFLFAGYIPNKAWTSINGIYLACWNGNILEWYDEAGKYSYEQLSLDFESNKQNAHEVIEKRVRLKKGLGKNKNKESGTDNK